MAAAAERNRVLLTKTRVKDLQRFSSNRSQRFKEEDLGNSPRRWAATVATYCLSRASKLLANNRKKHWERVDKNCCSRRPLDLLKTSNNLYCAFLRIYNFVFSVSDQRTRMYSEKQRYDGYFNNLAHPTWGTIGNKRVHGGPTEFYSEVSPIRKCVSNIPKFWSL